MLMMDAPEACEPKTAVRVQLLLGAKLLMVVLMMLLLMLLLRRLLMEICRRCVVVVRLLRHAMEILCICTPLVGTPGRIVLLLCAYVMHTARTTLHAVERHRGLDWCP